MKVIKLMADYDCYPLWHDSDEEVGNIDPSLLSISKDLHDELLSWADMYDLTLNRDDPALSGFRNIVEANNFYLLGKELSKRLACELGRDYVVMYNGSQYDGR